MNWNDIAQRAAATFGQAFLAVFVSSEAFSSAEALQSAAIAGAVAGASAVLSLLQNVIRQWLASRSAVSEGV